MSPLVKSESPSPEPANRSVIIICNFARAWAKPSKKPRRLQSYSIETD
jgi:hypothetical protein